MKKIIFSLVFVIGTGLIHAQDDSSSDSLGLPGDNLDLRGVLELFQKSASIEDFEKSLNSSSSNLNNLDLNNDNETDYIRVIDNSEKDAHALVLQIPVSDKESQDVAVIEIEKNSDSSATLQIVGDEELYGKDYYVEAQDEEEVGDDNSGSGRGPSPREFYGNYRRVVVVNVWVWPCVRFMYAPVYHPWVSPWYWGHYPGWWKPWHPVAWAVYHPRFVHCRARYHVVVVHRVRVAHAVYAPRRVHSAAVHTRYAANHQRYEARHNAPSNGRQGNAGGKSAGKGHASKGDGGKQAGKGGNASKGGKQGGGGGKASRGGNASKGGGAKKGGGGHGRGH